MIAKMVGRSFHYGWVIVGVTLLTLIVAAGVRSTPSVLIVPLGQEFGWDRATVSLAVSINLFLFGLCGPFAAALMERFGIRRVMLIALTTVGIAAALTTTMQAPWQLDLLWGVVVGTATGATATVLSATVSNRWFVKRRGLVVGLLSASSATGQLIFLPILAALVTNFGWRAASWTTAIATLAVVPIVALLMRNRPRDVGLLPYGAETEPEEASGKINPLARAIGALGTGLRSRDFWLLSGSFFICGATTNGLIGTHFIPASMDHGLTEVTAASLLATIGIFDIIGTTCSGWLSDRIDNRKLLAWYYGLRGLALLFLPYALGSSFFGSLVIFIVFYGLDWVATVPPTVRLASDVFGKANGSIMFGWIFAAHQLGSAVAAFGAGAIYTWLGDYTVGFMVAGLLCLLASGMSLRIGRKPASPERSRPLPVEAPAVGS